MKEKLSFNDKLCKINRIIATAVAFAIGMLHLLNVSGLILLSSTTLRVTHLMAMLVIALLMYSRQEKNNLGNTLMKMAFVLAAIAASVHLLTRWVDIASSGNVTNTADMIFGIIMVLVVLEATRRKVGAMLAAICLVFLIYPFVCQWLPGILQGRGYRPQRVFAFLYASSDGLYGIPISVSAGYIIIFCIYGAFLSEFGAGAFLFDLSTAVTRKLSAATAKTAIFFAALVGMISGSAAGNVAISGSLTIPMMKKRGYTAEQSGAITAVAATGGQIMPPVMGAAAFIMAELTGISYIGIMKAAIIPALLYYLSLLFVVHYEAKKGNIDQAHDANVRPLGEIIKQGWHNLVPILLLIVLLLMGYSPIKSAYFSTIALVIVYCIDKLVRKEFKLKETLLKIVHAVAGGAKDTSTMAIACAASGIIVGILSLSGLGSKIATVIVTVSGGSIFVALVLTMIASIILGMGLPTTAAYLVLASVIVPALTNMGLPVLTAHMFVFFFGCISTITPPVALASYVSAGIAGASLNKVGWLAVRYGLVSFVLPYMFVYGPSLLMQDSIGAIIQTVIASCIGIFGIALGLAGYFRTKINTILRLLLIAGGLLLVMEGLITDIIGIVCVGGIVAFELIRDKKNRAKVA